MTSRSCLCGEPVSTPKATRCRACASSYKRSRRKDGSPRIIVGIQDLEDEESGELSYLVFVVPNALAKAAGWIVKAYEFSDRESAEDKVEEISNALDVYLECTEEHRSLVRKQSGVLDPKAEREARDRQEELEDEAAAAEEE